MTSRSSAGVLPGKHCLTDDNRGICLTPHTHAACSWTVGLICTSHCSQVAVHRLRAAPTDMPLLCCCALLLHLQDKGLPVGLLLMMQHLVDLSTASRAAAAAAASPSAKGKKVKKPAVPEQVDPAVVAGSRDDQEAWLPELMASLCEKVSDYRCFFHVDAARESDMHTLVLRCMRLHSTACSQLAREETTFHICTSG